MEKEGFKLKTDKEQETSVHPDFKMYFLRFFQNRVWDRKIWVVNQKLKQLLFLMIRHFWMVIFLFVRFQRMYAEDIIFLELLMEEKKMLRL